MTDANDAQRAARARAQAEHRAIVQATMQAKRSGKLPPRASSGSEVVTAAVVAVTVLGILFLAIRYGN
jgi:hypothetical protein